MFPALDGNLKHPQISHDDALGKKIIVTSQINQSLSPTSDESQRTSTMQSCSALKHGQPIINSKNSDGFKPVQKTQRMAPEVASVCESGSKIKSSQPMSMSSFSASKCSAELRLDYQQSQCDGNKNISYSPGTARKQVISGAQKTVPSRDADIHQHNSSSFVSDMKTIDDRGKYSLARSQAVESADTSLPMTCVPNRENKDVIMIESNRSDISSSSGTGTHGPPSASVRVPNGQKGNVKGLSNGSTQKSRDEAGQNRTAYSRKTIRKKNISESSRHVKRKAVPTGSQLYQAEVRLARKKQRRCTDTMKSGTISINSSSPKSQDSSIRTDTGPVTRQAKITKWKILTPLKKKLDDYLTAFRRRPVVDRQLRIGDSIVQEASLDRLVTLEGESKSMWIDDEVVNAMTSIFADHLPDCAMISSLAMTMITDVVNGFGRYERKTEKERSDQLERMVRRSGKLRLGQHITVEKAVEKGTRIFAPCNVNDGTHWAGLFVDCETGVIESFDSFRNRELSALTKHAEALKAFLEKVCGRKGFEKTWTYIGDNKRSPQQLNSHDCAIYMLFTVQNWCRWPSGMHSKAGRLIRYIIANSLFDWEEEQRRLKIK